MSIGFHSLFSQIGSGTDFSPQAWKRYFETASLPLWSSESGGVSFWNNRGDKYSILIGYHEPGELAFAYDLYSKQRMETNFCFFSRASDEIGPDFELLDDGSLFPVGSFLPLDIAWLVFKQFLENPEQKPAATRWIDAESDLLEWPEDMA